RLRESGRRVAGLDLARAADVDLPLVADVTDAAAVGAAVRRVEDELGPVELAVTAAGTYARVPFEALDPDTWRRTVRLHLGGAANVCDAVVPGMRAAGRGCIVTISSELALAGGDGEAHYAAAKGAVVGFTRALGAELARHGVRVCSVAPGPTDTPLLAADSPWRAPAYLETLPLRRLVRPDEVAATVLFLADEGTYFAGQTLSPNAGAVI
ncbi:SDR family NAD(P)-dependent oxidoreductase, partial [Patulibacter sp. S7RM1-6]